jgi:hypothetical protein
MATCREKKEKGRDCFDWKVFDIKIDSDKITFFQLYEA